MKNNTAGVLKAVKKNRRGVVVEHHKNTENMPVERMPEPNRVVLSMQQHIGAPCVPTVKVGDVVDIGDVVGDSEAFVSAPVHASISGKVVAVGDVQLAHGAIAKAVTIESDGEMRVSPNLRSPVVTNKAELCAAARASGLVGLGGAGFPAHVKLNFPEDKNVDTLIVNAAECEPYITVDYRACIENPEDLMFGIYMLQGIYKFKNIFICIEDNKPEAFAVLKEIADADNEAGNEVRLMSLKSRYPQGAEKMMIYSATGRRVPPGKLPADAGCVVMNVGSVSFLGRYLRTGKPLVSRSVTVDGTAVKNPKNVRVPIGTKLQDIFDFCGGFKDDPKKIIFGGPMMGVAVHDTEGPICKQNNAILAFVDDRKLFKKERDCIRCGRCVSVCPMNLMPTKIESLVKLKDVEGLKAAGLMVCMECGSCSFACPSGRPLVQYFRLGKQIIKEEGAKK